MALSYTVSNGAAYIERLDIQFGRIDRFPHSCVGRAYVAREATDRRASHRVSPQ
jgi:hypothetical protein